MLTMLTYVSCVGLSEKNEWLLNQFRSIYSRGGLSRIPEHLICVFFYIDKSNICQYVVIRSCDRADRFNLVGVITVLSQNYCGGGSSSIMHSRV